MNYLPLGEILSLHQVSKSMGIIWHCALKLPLGKVMITGRTNLNALGQLCPRIDSLFHGSRIGGDISEKVRAVFAHLAMSKNAMFSSFCKAAPEKGDTNLAN